MQIRCDLDEAKRCVEGQAFQKVFELIQCVLGVDRDTVAVLVAVSLKTIAIFTQTSQ